MSELFTVCFEDNKEYRLRISELPDGEIEFRAIYGDEETDCFIAVDLPRDDVITLIKKLAFWMLDEELKTKTKVKKK